MATNMFYENITTDYINDYVDSNPSLIVAQCSCGATPKFTNHGQLYTIECECGRGEYKSVLCKICIKNESMFKSAIRNIVSNWNYKQSILTDTNE